MMSIWNSNFEIKRREALTGDLTCEILVVGGGITGILTAYFLAKEGAQVVVIDRGRIGSGTTAGTTAKITAQHGLIYHQLIGTVGEVRAAQYARANAEAVEQYANLIEKENIDCNFIRKNAYLYAVSHTEKLEQEIKAAEKLGLSMEFVKETELPFYVPGAAKLQHQAQFHPLKFISNLADGLTVFENTTALSIEDHRVRTDLGVIRANQIVVATHFPVINFPGLYFARQHQQRSYLLALESAPMLQGMYIGIGENTYSLSSMEGLMLLGGAGHRTGTGTGDSFAQLSRAARQYYPHAKEKYRWAAQDCMPIDGIPYIGRFVKKTPNLYVATGFQKWGMTTAMVAATILSDTLCGRENKTADVFSPQRFYFLPSVKKLSKTVGLTTVGLCKTAFFIPKKHLWDIRQGEGKIVSYHGKKAGVYKDGDGHIYAVTVKCPHLGCELVWNAEEKTWDCPCHGSRFDYRGKLLNSPAQTDIGIDIQ